MSSNVAWSHDDQRLAIAVGKCIFLRTWHANSGLQQGVETLGGHLSQVTSVAFSPTESQRLASASEDKTLRLWDAARERELLMLHGHREVVSSVAWSPDGLRLASGSHDCTLRIWRACCSGVSHAGECLKTLTGHSGGVTNVAYSPGRQMLLSGSADNTLRIWDVETGECAATLQGHSKPVSSVSWIRSDRNMVASGSMDSTVRIWDVKTGAYIKTLTGHSGGVTCVAFSPDEMCIASGSDDCTLRIWDATSGKCIRTIRDNEEVTGVAWSPDTMKLTVNYTSGFGIISLNNAE